MPEASSPHADATFSGRDLAYRAAADRHWIAAGSTAAAVDVDMAQRRATRTSAGQPLNLTVYDLALDHERTLEEFACNHGRGEEIPSDRTALAMYAAAIAVERPEAAAEYETRQLESSLRVALTLGDSDDALGWITCPKCLCWSLIPRTAWERWWAECQVASCAYDPDPLHDRGDTVAPTSEQPRLWSLRRIASHHLSERLARPA